MLLTLLQMVLSVTNFRFVPFEAGTPTLCTYFQKFRFDSFIC